MARRYVFGPGDDAPVLQYEGAGTSDRRYLYADERGSITRILRQDGSLVSINAYDEHGIPSASSNGRFRFTGQMWLPSLGLYNYKARMYSPSLGRFMQTDPIGYGDGLNWYDYVGGDPVNASDPSGMQTNNDLYNVIGTDIIVIAPHRNQSGVSGGFSNPGGINAGDPPCRDARVCKDDAEPRNDDIVVTAPKPPRNKDPKSANKAIKPAYCSSFGYQAGGALNTLGEVLQQGGVLASISGIPELGGALYGFGTGSKYLAEGFKWLGGAPPPAASASSAAVSMMAGLSPLGD